MKLHFLLLMSLFYINSTAAQTPYFQQQVNYTIRVSLNDSLHVLTGDMDIEYINNSPHTLDTIWMNLWVNAYKNNNTEFAKQQLRLGNDKFYFAEKEDLGRFKNLEFSVYGEKAIWKSNTANPDIAWIKLPQPLAAGARIHITTPLHIKIPASFSRLGHVGTSYQITQWYPKPAVFDHKGWHPMPYLDMGEFYSEFGNFDVSITLPSNYVVAATGVLQTDSERTFLQQREAATQTTIANKAFTKNDTFPASATTEKTIRYTAENVHDFAWFADKRFYVISGDATLPNGKMVAIHAFFTNTEADLWVKGADYVTRAVEFYSKHLGAYPYPQATAVQSALSAGGGMEYPMITVIGKSGSAESLDEVITHEVGHNWFYGILASNERDHPWMDEGMNSYYEHRYMQTYYKSQVAYGNFMTQALQNSGLDFAQLYYLFLARRRLDQAPNTHSNRFSDINYGLGAYQKPASAFSLLEQYLGTAEFDNALQQYYNTWKFKHPYPEDLRASLEQTTGKNLGWLFDGLINSNKLVDYEIDEVQKNEGDYKVKVENESGINTPFALVGIKDNKPVHTQWYSGFDDEKELLFKGGDYDKILLNNNFDLNPNDNLVFLNKRKPFKVKLWGIENPNHHALYCLPLIAWNDYDKTMLGVALHNLSVLEKPFEYFVAPMYALNTKDIVGVAEVDKNFYPNNNYIRQIQVGADARTFNSNYNFKFKYHQQYFRMSPFVTLKLHTNPADNYNHSLTYRMVYYGEEEASFGARDTITNEVPFTGKYWNTYLAHQLIYKGEIRRAPTPMSWNVTITQQGRDNTFTEKENAFDNYFQKRINYVRLAAEYNLKFYYEHKKAISFRAFAGFFLGSTERNAGYITPSAFSVAHNGQNDFLYDNFYFGRNERGSDDVAPDLWVRQLSMRDGAFKTPFDSRYVNQFGHSNKYLLALNIVADLPMRLPMGIKPYGDIAYYGNRTQEGETPSGTFVWDVGMQISPIPDFLTIYLPIFNDDLIKNRFLELEQQVKPFLGTKYWNRISFYINFNKVRRNELVNMLR
ncbi:MAG: M1 family metallopeptidase [Saprospiraceae bacterium]|nr:M1 family metallopeptidase [Saprospiraceae bacterium]